MTALDRFLTWWAQELRALIPGSNIFGNRQELVASVEGDEIHLALRRGRQIKELGPEKTLPERTRKRLVRAVRDGFLRTVLVVPEHHVLRQELKLPLAANEDLENVLRFELERVTPFKSTEIYSDHRRRPESDTATHLMVDLVLTPRSAVDPFLKKLGDVTLPAKAIDIADPDGALQRFNLLSGSQASTRSSGQRLSLGLAGIAVALSAVWVWTVFDVQNAEIERLESRLVQERRALIGAQDALAPTGENADIKAKAFEKRRSTPLAVETLDAIAKALPDHSWVERVALRGDRVEFSGTSADATELIRLFSEHPGFTEPRFRSPVTRALDGNAERFTMEMRLRPRDGEK